VIAYAYDAKAHLLSVDQALLETKGAVSEEVVTQMAKGAIKNLDVDCAIAVSGIMGPGGETPINQWVLCGLPWATAKKHRHRKCILGSIGKEIFSLPPFYP
jgi:PncC family amidohydrolase